MSNDVSVFHCKHSNLSLAYKMCGSGPLKATWGIILHFAYGHDGGKYRETWMHLI
jgi:hypothetical protein